MSVPVARAGAGLRLLRAAVFAAVCVALSAAGHVLGSCAGVPLWTLGAGFLAVLAATAPLAGRERSLPGIAAGLALGQLTLHALFGLGQQVAAVRAGGPPSQGTLVALAARLVCGGDGGPVRLSPAEAHRILTMARIDPSAAGAAGHAAHAAGAHGAGPYGAAAMPSSPWFADTVLPSLPMFLGHLLAAVVIGLVLRRGEAAVFRLVRLSAREVAQQALVRPLRAAFALVRALRAGLPGSRAGIMRAPGAHGRAKAAPQPLVLEHVVIRRGPPRCALAA